MLAMVTVMEQDKNTEEIKDRIATIIKGISSSSVASALLYALQMC